MKDRSCCFTEHRPNSLPFGYNEHEESCVKLKAILTDTIEKQITENGVTHFISGMAMGVDTFAAEAVLKLKENIRRSLSNVLSPAKRRRQSGRKIGVNGITAS